MAGSLKAGVGALALTVTLAAPATAGAVFAPGSSGLGDPFFPNAGNGGYDVGHYDLALRYRPQSGRLVARARIVASATQDLSSFSLDYRGPKVTAVAVGGAPAGFARSGHKLFVTPAAGLGAGTEFTVEVEYRGRPRRITDPDGSMEGWIRTDDGAFVVGEPRGSPTWFPCNDALTDKATYSIRVKVPRGVEAVANGSLVERRRAGRWTSWTWHESAPMATYLATATIGNFRLRRARVAGLESIVALDPRERRDSRRALSKMGHIIRLFRSLYGPYPFEEVGAIVDHAPRVGYALETQTRPIFDRSPSDVTVAHELSHQWFGDSVSLRTWPDMWLNEGFATWSEWRWTQARGGLTTKQQFQEFLRQPASRKTIWDPPPAAIPDPTKLFADSVYVRGAMTLEAVRQRIGNATFLRTLRDWTTGHAYGNATTADFIGLAEANSGQDLGSLFDTWLYQRGKPAGDSAGRAPAPPRLRRR